MKLRKLSLLLFVVLLAHGGIAAEQPAPQSIILASTTSVENSGLLARILPAFTKETGITVHVLAQGTGQALQTAARNDADLVLVHDPDAEEKFIATGDGSDRRHTSTVCLARRQERHRRARASSVACSRDRSRQSRRRVVVSRHRRRHGRGAKRGAGNKRLHDQRSRYLAEFREQG